jgi:hypothetical protein
VIFKVTTITDLETGKEDRHYGAASRFASRDVKTAFTAAKLRLSTNLEAELKDRVSDKKHLAEQMKKLMEYSKFLKYERSDSKYY